MRFVLVCVLFFVARFVQCADTLEQEFDQSVRPFLQTHCVSCHNAETTEGDLDLDADRDVRAVTSHFRHWMVVMDRLESGEMPPSDADVHPTLEERKQVVRWIAEVRKREAERRSGDPGIVLARRLSNAEYNNTIRDLTGYDLQPAKDFPIDPANQEGFDNSGESLTMSPSLLKKYLEAARRVSDHLVLTPTGIDFAPYPVITDTDRDKYCVNRIIEFYQRQRLDYKDFFFALWQYEHRVEFGYAEPLTLEQFAVEVDLSPKYLDALRTALDREGHAETLRSAGPMVALQLMWQSLPREVNQESKSLAAAQCERMRDFVVDLRKRLIPEVENLTTPEVHKGSQPLVLWKNRQFVANRRRYAGGALDIGDLGLEPHSDEALAMTVPTDDDQRKNYEQAFQTFCSLFPDAFFVSERARVYLDPEEEKGRTGRLLSAGFHSQMGYFRDDQPLCELVLSDAERLELDQRWLELDFVASAPIRQYTGFIWFDRTDSRFMRDPEFDRFRAEDKDCTSRAKVQALAKAYLDKAERVGGNPEALKAIRFYFDDMSRTFRDLERLQTESEPLQLDAVVAFARRAFRRPLTEEQHQNIRSFYHRLRSNDGLSHDQAIRDSLTAILMSPHFCYRLDLPRQSVADSDVQAVEPLDDDSLASRLSYFLWASMPDQELFDLAEAGQLHQRDVLLGQVARMLADERSASFVNEFAGNWLGFRRFQSHQGVDRERFPQFTDPLRQAMYEEPIRFMTNLIQNDGSVLEMLYADYVIVNGVLADHYGIPADQITETVDGWGNVADAASYGRGGLMPMAVFLTNNSPGLRTSPVKRGNWLVKQVLGEHIPAPPAAVPELPADESMLGDLTLRETLERHRADPSCAACHDRIDSFGLVFEQYGPIGERRERDLGGRLVDSAGEFPDGSRGKGIDGLREYIRSERQQDFIENFCRKLLAYGLGRSLQLSDEPQVEAMKSTLSLQDDRFAKAVEMVVIGEAFLHKRVIAELE